MCGLFQGIYDLWLTIWHRERLWLTSVSSDRISISSLPSNAFILSCLFANLKTKPFTTASLQWLRFQLCRWVITAFPLISPQGALFTLFLNTWQLNTLTLILVFLPLLVVSAGQREPPWPPLSSLCHWSPPRRWSRGPLRRAPSRLLSTLLILQRPTRWPGSSLLSAHCGCSPEWVLIPHHGGLKWNTGRSFIAPRLWEL